MKRTASSRGERSGASSARSMIWLPDAVGDAVPDARRAGIAGPRAPQARQSIAIIPAVERRPGDAELLQGSACRQVGVLDQPDDLESSRMRGISCLVSPIPGHAFFEQTVFEGEVGHDLLQGAGPRAAGP